MAKRYEYKGHEYWVTVEPAIHQTTKETGYIAYVNDSKPGGLLYGYTVKDERGHTIFFNDSNMALVNANAVKQSEIDSAG